MSESSAETTTTMLRRYGVKAGGAQEFIEWWAQHIPPLRTAAGFTIEWAYLDRDNDTFTWAISYPGDRPAFEAADARYAEQPERAAAIAAAPPLTSISVGFPELVLATN